MATIKKGTYRFNDVLTYSADLEANIEFTSTDLAGVEGTKIAVYYDESLSGGSIGVNFTASMGGTTSTLPVYVSTEGNYWNTLYNLSSGTYSKGLGQVITVTEETEVDEDFATWFTENTEAVSTEPETPTAESVKAKIQSLINKANTTTGKSDTDLTGAVLSLAEGYGVGEDSPLPIEVATEAEMTALLETADVGSVYKYTGTTGTYENGALYVVEVSE